MTAAALRRGRRDLVVIRPAATLAHLAQPLVAACRALARGRSLSDRWWLGDPPEPPGALDDVTVGRFVARVARRQAQGGAEPCWFTATDERDPPTLAITIEASGAGPLALARCALSDPLPPAPAQAGLVRDVAEAMGALQAYIDDEALALRYFSQRATERARAGAPPELRGYIPDPPVLEDNAGLDLLVSHDYDGQRAPAGVFWINYWSAALVAALGAARVREAGWAEVIDAANGGLVLVATDEPLDPDEPRHRDVLRRLLRSLDLRAAQEAVAHTA